MGSTKQVKYARTIVMIGFMGCGKSTLGRALAKLMGVRFVDLDHEIVCEAGLKIPQIFAKYGENGFRRLESRVLQKALLQSKKKGGVIATGGGVLTRPLNRRLLKTHVRAKVSVQVVWVDPSWNVLWSRLRNSTRSAQGRCPRRSPVRPLLIDPLSRQIRSEREVRRRWQDRRGDYKKASQIRIRVFRDETWLETLERLQRRINEG